MAQVFQFNINIEHLFPQSAKKFHKKSITPLISESFRATKGKKNIKDKNICIIEYVHKANFP